MYFPPYPWSVAYKAEPSLPTRAAPAIRPCPSSLRLVFPTNPSSGQIDGGGGGPMRVAMFGPDGSPMRFEASSASRSRGRISAYKGESLPLIDCPQCKIPVVKLRSKKQESYGMIFYKCPNNFPDDDTCGYYWWEGAYVKYLRTRRMKDLEMAEEHEIGEQKLMEMRQQLCELKNRMEELKQMCQGKSFVVSNAILASVCVGVVFGLILGMVWK